MVDTKILKQYGEERASGTFAGDVIIIVTCMLLISVAAFGSVGAVKSDVRILYLVKYDFVFIDRDVTK